MFGTRGKRNQRIAAAVLQFIALLATLALALNVAQAQTTRPTHVPGRPVTLPKMLTLDAGRLRLSYPADFVEGSLEQVPDDAKRFFEGAVAILEVSVAESLDLSNVPLGEEAPKITIHLLSRSFTGAVFLPVIEPAWRTKIGEHHVVKFPAFPGPTGERAHCYLVTRRDGSAILFLADRMATARAGNVQLPTHYDWVIERMIASMELRDEPAATQPGLRNR